VKTVAELNLADKLVEEIRRMNNGSWVIGDEIGRDTDLLATGVVDSLGLVELLNFMEVEYGYNIDLLDADPAQFSTIRGLCELALKQAR
jgi:acyl carrier protein